MSIDVSRPQLSVEHSPVRDTPELVPDLVEADLIEALRPRLADVVPEHEVAQRVHDAFRSLGAVRVTTYLPILVERRVRQSVRGLVS
jgi:hypothetical protein